MPMPYVTNFVYGKTQFMMHLWAKYFPFSGKFLKNRLASSLSPP